MDKGLLVVIKEKKVALAVSSNDSTLKGLGYKVLDILNGNIEMLERNIVNVECISTEKVMNACYKAAGSESEFYALYPEVSKLIRNGVLAGMDIFCGGADEALMEIVHGSHIRTMNEIAIVSDSYICLHAYVVDLDIGQFEVYNGFNPERLHTDDRFAIFDVMSPIREKMWYSVRMVKSYSLSDLPDKDTFFTDCNICFA